MPPLHRPRRLRTTAPLRDAVRETTLRPASLVWPLFIYDGDDDVPIGAMPGVSCLSADGLMREVARGLRVGIDKVILFPRVDASRKTTDAEEAWNPDGLVPASVAALKRRFGDAVCVMTDVALDPYNADGHDGLVGRDDRRPWRGGFIDNDATLEALAKQALAHAQAGADVVAPSDMMDGRVAAIRAALDAGRFADVGIMAYTAKYASAFYGPFREALDSAPRGHESRDVPADKRTYQMDPGNVREALREAALDEAEGADVLLVKPAGPYLDVVRAVRGATTLPVAAYQVSGEYAMLVHGAAAGAFDERAAVLESLTGVARAGADLIVTYFAPRVAAWLREG
jgi:porphobilinogen synthase